MLAWRRVPSLAKAEHGKSHVWDRSSVQAAAGTLACAVASPTGLEGRSTLSVLCKSVTYGQACARQGLAGCLRRRARV